jgi:DNA polymerase elongation subunit (family B)
MNVEEIKQFLRNKKGYLKEGSKRLKRHLLQKGFDVTLSDCIIALRDVRREFRTHNNISVLNKSKVLIYDIETSYNIVKSWRVGYNLNIQPNDILHERKIICISYRWFGEDQIYNLSWDKNQCDKFMIEQFIEVLNEADLIVSHNGDKFDLPWIKTRALYHNLPMLVNYKQFDTLKVAKRKFNFNSNRLDYISEFLGFGNKIKTEMALWDNIILNKCPDAMKKMITYCDMDVELLSKVYDKLVYWENPMHHNGVDNNLPKYTSPISGSLNLKLVKSITTNRGTVKHVMRDLDTDRLFEMSDTNFKKYKLNK